MISRRLVLVCTLVLIGAVLVRTTHSQEKQPVRKPAPRTQEGTPPMSPAAKALKLLKADEGKWDAAITFWFKPGMEPTKCHADVTAKMDLRGMFLEQRFEGVFGPEMKNKPFTTLSYTGFNATTNQYEAVRMASTHSTMIVVRGKAKPDDSKGLDMELLGEYQFAGGKATQRDVIHHEGPDKCVIESWMSFGATEEFKGAEMVLTRVK